MFDKVARHFYDDTCVVPEKVEGESLIKARHKLQPFPATEQRMWWRVAGDIKQESGLFREGPSYQRRGSLQLWQFLVALLDDPSNSHFIAWTGRGMEFKLIEPEEVRRLILMIILTLMIFPLLESSVYAKKKKNSNSSLGRSHLFPLRNIFCHHILSNTIVYLRLRPLLTINI